MNDILGRAVIEVRKSAFDFDNSDKKQNWTAIQFWAVMKLLAKSDGVSRCSFATFFQDTWRLS